MPIVTERQPGDDRPPAQCQAAEHVVAEMAFGLILRGLRVEALASRRSASQVIA